MPTPIARACAACLHSLADTGRAGPQQMGDLICHDADAAPDKPAQGVLAWMRRG